MSFALMNKENKHIISEKLELIETISPLIGKVYFRESIVYDEEEVFRAYFNIDNELHYFIKSKYAPLGIGQRLKITSTNLYKLSESELMEVWKIYLENKK